MINRDSKKGFSLPEVMVAMTVIVMVVYAASTLLGIFIKDSGCTVNISSAFKLNSDIC